MADFTGFYFDGIHSSTYHVLRTSDGDRYKEGLFPEFEDRTIELVGGDVSLYEGTNFKQTEFTINIAFDSIIEEDFKNIKKWLQPNKLKEFRFDERPYKAYWAKLRSRPVFEYVCFMEEREDGFPGEKQRVYKGEASLDFVAYNPFGYCNDNSTVMTENGLSMVERGINWQVLDTYVPFTIIDDNVSEWGEVSGLKNGIQMNEYNEFTRKNNGTNYTYTAYLYNPGDFDADFELFFDWHDTRTDVTEKLITLTLTDSEQQEKSFQFSINKLNLTDRIILNTKKHSLEVYSKKDDNSWKKNLRYDLVKSTDWIKIPQGESTIKVKCDIQELVLQIKYNYKYY
jgi:hypothetical protein